MKRKELIESIKSVVILAVMAVLPIQASAGTIYLGFSNSGGASGSLNGQAFTNASWELEYEVDDTVLDSRPNTDSGHYIGAITGGSFTLNQVGYTLASGSEVGNVFLSNYATGYNGVSINPTSGGFMQFITNSGTIFPDLFSDVNTLTSANLGTTVFDVTTDAWANQSIISYQNYYDAWGMFGPPGNHNGIYTTGGDIISIYESSGPASGNFSVSTSGISSSGASQAEVSPVPVSAVVWLFGFGLLGLVGVARRKARLILTKH